MCRLSDAELNCVNTNIRMTSELMQFEIGTSTRRYFPPSGTAGFERCAVSGNKRLPAPPPRITAKRLCLEGMDEARIFAILSASKRLTVTIRYNLAATRIGRIHSRRQRHRMNSETRPTLQGSTVWTKVNSDS